MRRRFSVVLAAVTLLAGCYVETQPMPADASGEVVVENPPAPPPPPPEPAPPPPPTPAHVWVAGYHRWDGRAYVWERGHYVQPPRQNARYVPAHWEARAHGKVWVNGHWS